MFNLSQTDQAPNLWQDLVKQLEETERQGAQVFGQVAGRSIGIIMNWQLTAHPFATYPSFVRLMNASPAEKLAAIRDPAFKAQVMSEQPMHIGDFETFVTTTFSKMYGLGESGVDYEPSADTSVAAIAQREGRDPRDVAWDLMAADGGHDDVAHCLTTRMATSISCTSCINTAHTNGVIRCDAHCGAICDGGMPTFMLTHWTETEHAAGSHYPTHSTTAN